MIFPSDNPTGDVAPAPAQTPEATTPPSPITTKDLADFKAALEQSLDAKLAKVYQGIQSKTDKFTDRVSKLMKGYEDNAAKLGVQLTDDDRKALQNSAKYQILTEGSSPSNQSYVYQPGQAVPQGLSDDEFSKGVEAAATNLFKTANVEIKRGDPEDALIAAAEDKSPDEYLAAVKQAIVAKQARLGQQPPPAAQPTTPATATNFSPGQVRGTPQSNPIANIMDPAELWRLANKQG